MKKGTMKNKRRSRRTTQQSQMASQPKQPKRRAIVLMVVLVTVAIIALGSYTFSDLMTTHHEATQLTGRQQQARYIVEAGTEFLKYMLTQDEESQLEAGGVFDNMSLFMAQPVSGVQDNGTGEIDLSLRGNFTIIAPALDEMGYISGIRYGLEDESVRLNLNSLLVAEDTIPDSGRTLLMAIPGMTEDVADSILDWIDEDDEPREYGAELEYY